MTSLPHPKAIEEMDCLEGVASGHYERIPVSVELKPGENVEAITYVAAEDFVCEAGKPSPDDLHKIVSGAQHHSPPEEYVSRIEGLAK